MDIKLIRKSENLIYAEAKGKYIAEYCRDSSDSRRIQIFLYDPVCNFIREIVPERKKYDLIDIRSAIWNNQDIFYSSYEVTEDGRLLFSIYRYSIEDDQEIRLCYVTESTEVLDNSKKIRLFILSDTSVLIQTETIQNTDIENLMGNIAFRLALCNLENGEVTTVKDPNFINNGISSIIPVSDTRIMLKTGYSFLEDDRLDSANENEALIESVYITTSAKLIADITLANESVDMILIESVYFDRHITGPFVTDEYIHFCIADADRKNVKCVFYNSDTGERLEYSVNSFNPDDLYITYVLDHVPYVRKQTEGTTSFFNLRKASSDIAFYGEEFRALYSDIFITESLGKKQRMHIYSYPGLELLMDEKSHYHTSCCRNKEYYIYIADH
ncbi:MAG: hypothetical protein HUJ76_00105 [Parasporobacterium sp.]|nr:hypothetical protein [Parasporobacterium sp.]